MDRVRLTEIFYSLQGETRTSGYPTTFIRLTGCPLRCTWCDTTYSFTGGEDVAIAEVTQKASLWRSPYITVTGGEPLAQRAAWPLIATLCDLEAEVSVETSGAISIDGLDPRAVIVMDWKAPDSGEQHRNLWDNLERLKAGDTLKFVLASRQDYQWARMQLSLLPVPAGVDLVFSPVVDSLPASQLANWIVDDRLHVRMQVQLHKLLWGDEPGH